MNLTVEVDVGFHTSTRASVRLTNTAMEEDARFGEILLFTLFAIRQMVNDRGLPGQFTAHMLSQTSESLDETLDSHGWGRVELIEFPGHPAPKGFAAALTLRDDIAHLNMEPRGFGVLGKGIAYYSPHAVQLLLLHLIHAHQDDESFLGQLAACADNAGTMFKVGQLSVQNQLEAGYYIAQSICLEKTGLASPSEIHAVAVRTEPPEREVAGLMRVWEKVVRKR